jgi:citrate lyase subunit beta/citryl-CoA lyase
VIVDLEDAVPLAEKTAARNAVAKGLNPAQPVIVRINGVDTNWFRDDVTVCRMPGVAGIMLPKTEGIEHLRRVEELLGESLPILTLIENAQGFANALEIAKDAAVHRLDTLDGTVISMCDDRHRHQEWLKILRVIDDARHKKSKFI